MEYANKQLVPILFFEFLTGLMHVMTLKISYFYALLQYDAKCQIQKLFSIEYYIL